MEIKISKRKMEFSKVLSSLDEFVINFVKLLAKMEVEYVLVSGYVAILFGRSRNTEDVDILIAKMPFEKFEDLWNQLKGKYSCLNASDPKQAYKFLESSRAVRFSIKDKFIPNMEVKFLKDQIDKYALDNCIEVKVNNKIILISPLELQIVYKLFLGSEKDIEDARFLFKLFRENLDLGELQKLITDFNISSTKVKEYLGEYT